MYLCDVCGALSGRGQRRSLHVVYRQVTVTRPTKAGIITGPVRQIEREIPVCRSCKEALDTGETLAELRNRLADERAASPVFAGVIDNTPEFVAEPPARSSPSDGKSAAANGKSVPVGVPAEVKVPAKPKTKGRNPLFLRD